MGIPGIVSAPLAVQLTLDSTLACKDLDPTTLQLP